ncbi:Ku protein [Gordonia terrae]|jgi:DNA end-binding protein Ku|uniref:Non-homologous end joining protein Ku n=2 Tax=Gordonia terrae TaxID=2055 RepID=A0AAD0KAT2_9ACTN|nr:Ku protein [Gordonia terrae]VTR08297.1 Ku protein [Clostridioides difficile]ANY25383.1 Ku protein [Gordonia terrae]AWO86135.1 Ku protein [Gordonia terrae]VTS63051.1 valyl-tRNA synthetase [Gordonia terrae]GAB43518.1 putative DNA end-binding protein Ku [Gordonia terrae NBRC 100016]
MRSIWKGDLSFGLVNVPVKVYSATESHDRKSYQVDSSDGTRIRYRRVREGTDTEVDYGDIANAYESESGETVILTKDDLATLPVQKSPEISILEFVPAEQVDPIYFDKPYYLEPSSKSPKAYVLLAKALEETDRLAIASFTLRNRTRVAALRVVDGVMTLQTLLWPDEVRKPDFGFLDDDTEIRDQELQMAASLIESMASDYDPSEFEDTYQNELTKLIEAKSEGGEAFPETDDEDNDTEDSDVADLLAALRASVKDRGEPDSEDKPAEKTTAKKAPAKKAAAKKAPVKKAAAKKTATKSTAKKAPAKKSSRKAS